MSTSWQCLASPATRALRSPLCLSTYSLTVADTLVLQAFDGLWPLTPIWGFVMRLSLNCVVDVICGFQAFAAYMGDIERSQNKLSVSYLPRNF